LPLIQIASTDFVASEKGQRIIRDYGKELYGQGLYNDAAYAGKHEDSSSDQVCKSMKKEGRS